MIWHEWWVWMVAAIGLAVLEVLAPGYVLLGFALGAVLVSGLLAFGAAPSAPVLALVFALASLIAWFALRRMFGIRRGQVKIWDRDINDN